MKNRFRLIFSLLVLIFLIGCTERTQPKDEKTGELYEVSLNGPTVICINPDSMQLATLKEEWGEESFYTYADDFMWYDYQLQHKAQFSDITLVQTQSKNVLLNGAQGFQYEIKPGMLDGEWSNYFYHRPGKEVMKFDIDGLLDQLEAEYPTIEQVAVIINETVLRKAPDLDSEQVSVLSPGQLVHKRQLVKQEPTTDDQDAFCFENTWLSVKTEEEEEGWVFGKDLKESSKTSGSDKCRPVFSRS